MNNSNQKNLNELKRIHSKIVYIMRIITPAFIILMIPILIISIFIYIYVIFIWLIGFFLSFSIAQYLDYRQNRLTFKCWYPEKIFQSDLNALYYILFAINLIIIFFGIFFYLYLKIPFIDSIPFIIYVIMINSILPVIIHMKKKHFKDLDSEAKHFKLKFDKLENIAKKVIQESKIAFQVIQNKSIWKPKKSVFKLKNKLEIEVFQGKGNGIRIKPIETNLRKSIDGIQ